MKKFLLFPLIFLLLAGCGPQEAQAQFFAMDTAMFFTAYGPAAGDALADAQKEVFRLDSILSRTRADSDVSRLNAAAGSGEAVALDPDTYALLGESLAAARDTGGAFDPTIAPVMDAWGFTHTDGYRIPPRGELDALLPLVNARGLSVGPDVPEASLEAPGMAVDLGGIAKGYTAEQVVAQLRTAGVSSALLSLGGSTVAAVGVRPNGDPWRIGVRNPETQEGYLCILGLTDEILSTSGGYERSFEENGSVYHHILNPETGFPSDSDLLSVTVVAAHGALTDAYSTALFVLGSEAALDLWRARSDFELLLIRSDLTILVTEGLEGDFSFQGEEAGYSYEIVRR